MIQQAIHQLVENRNLDFETTKAVMDEIMSGQATQAQISSFLTALRMKGETIDEITACATVMRDKAVKLNPPFSVMDIVGTGGDEVKTVVKIFLSITVLPKVLLVNYLLRLPIKVFVVWSLQTITMRHFIPC